MFFLVFSKFLAMRNKLFLRNLHRRFVLCSNSQIYGGDFAKFCGLLRIYELYTIPMVLNSSLILPRHQTALHVQIPFILILILFFVFLHDMLFCILFYFVPFCFVLFSFFSVSTARVNNLITK